MPPTLTVVTGNGGVYLYYRPPDDASLIGDWLWLLHGVDVKAAAGMLVAPPSRSILGGEFVFTSPVRTPAVLPSDVLRRLRRKPRGRQRIQRHATLHVPNRSDRAAQR